MRKKDYNIIYMNIVFCLDKNILQSLKAIITSINHNTKRKLNYYVICPSQDRVVFEKFFREKNLNINLGIFEPTNYMNKLIKNCNYYSGSKIANYSRFFIKKVFPNLKKIIYLDTDMLVLDDIGKLWDSVQLSQDNFFASPKYIWFHKIFYIKRLEYYYNYFNNKNFFNGGVFITDLTYWDDSLYNRLYQITFELIDNNISHTFTEPILNCLFPNFIPLDPAWNCSGYGSKKWYYLLKLIYYNIEPKIIHWSGHMKPWHNLNVYKEKLWKYYLNENRQFVYLLYYDDNPKNGQAKLFLESVKNLNFNLVPHNVYQYEKFIKFDIKFGRNIRRHYCIQYFINNRGLDNYYFFSDAYDIYFIKFNYKIFEYMEENKIKVLYQNNSLGFRKDLFSNNVTNFYSKDIFSKSFGINGGSFIGKGYNILNYYDNVFKYIKENDWSDEALVIESPNLGNYILIDTKFFLNCDSVYKAFKFHDFIISDMKIHMELNPDIILFHYCGSHLHNKYIELQSYLKNNTLDDMKYSNFRYFVLKFYYIITYFFYPILKLFVITINRIKKLFNYKEK